MSSAVYRGSTLVLLALLVSSGRAGAQVPPGFTPLLTRDAAPGWHKSRVSHHGTDLAADVKDGVLSIGQSPFYEGGLLLTDTKYRNFELYLEIDPAIGCDGGIFLRSSENGNAYQVTMDNPTAATLNGNLIAEDRPAITSARNTIVGSFLQGQWNTVRIRMTGGDTPRIALWLNGKPIWNVQQPRSHFFTDRQGGSIGLQAHFNSWYERPSWRPGQVHRYRNIAIKVLP